MTSKLDAPNHPLQPSFRQENLVTVDNFIRICKENEIKTDKQELSFLAREGLVYPAVRVHRGYFPCKKVVTGNTYTIHYKDEPDKKTYAALNAPEVLVLGIPQPGSIFTHQEIRDLKKRGITPHTAENWLDPYLNEGSVTYPSQLPFVKPEERKTSFHEFSANKADLGWPYMDFYNQYQLDSVVIR